LSRIALSWYKPWYKLSRRLIVRAGRKERLPFGLVCSPRQQRQSVCAKTGSGVFGFRTPDSVFAPVLSAEGKILDSQRTAFSDDESAQPFS
jgi:hypothetical protein